jgi:hypothetical protein
MTVLCAGVQTFVLSVLNAWHHDSLCAGAAAQPIRVHRPARDTLLLAQQALGGCGVTAALNQNIEHRPMLVHRKLQPMPLAGDADHDLIKMPFGSWGRKTAADLVCKDLGGQNLFDHPHA